MAPSLPGYGFSSAPPHPGFGAAAMAATFDKLMLALGYSKYVVQGEAPRHAAYLLPAADILALWTTASCMQHAVTNSQLQD